MIYLNIEIDLMKQLAIDALEGGEPVWFGCDVGQQFRRDIGIWDAKLFDFENVYDMPFDLTKSERLNHHQTS